MNNNLDVLFIAPSNASGIYQDLAKDYAGIEPDLMFKLFLLKP